MAREIYPNGKKCGPVFFLMGGGSSDWWLGVEDSMDSIHSSRVPTAPTYFYHRSAIVQARPAFFRGFLM